MRKFSSFFLLAFLINQNLKAQWVTDSAPTGGENILPVEGGGYKMKIDSVTPLGKLVNKLNGEWRFIETGKGYWIGYTNDMFSIAARGDEAIPVLINFIDTTQNKRGQWGAIYTLHLIGIQRRIVGRFDETFVNTKARLALLGLLKEKEYSYRIIELLMRDPWKCDIPYFLEILKTETDDEITWPIINCLNRYQIRGLPITTEIPDTLGSLKIKLKVENENVLERDFDFSAQIKEALKEFATQYPASIKIEKELYTDNLSKYYSTKLSSTLNVREFLSDLGIKGSFFSYVEIGCKLQYYIKDDKIYFCTIKTAQDRLNSWWANLPVEEKEKFK